MVHSSWEIRSFIDQVHSDSLTRPRLSTVHLESVFEWSIRPHHGSGMETDHSWKWEMCDSLTWKARYAQHATSAHWTVYWISCSYLWLTYIKSHNPLKLFCHVLYVLSLSLSPSLLSSFFLSLSLCLTRSNASSWCLESCFTATAWTQSSLSSACIPLCTSVKWPWPGKVVITHMSEQRWSSGLKEYIKGFCNIAPEDTNIGLYSVCAHSELIVSATYWIQSGVLGV